MQRLACLIVYLAVAAGAPAVYAQYEHLEGDPSPFSDAALISESAWIVPGTPFTVGLQLLLDQGWHSYWINPGDSGEPVEISWDLPEGFAAGAVQWPFPEKIDAGPLRSYGYADEVILLTTITPAADLVPGTDARIAATANWLICDDVCLFAEESVSVSLPVQTRNAPRTFAAEFARTRSKLPVMAPDWQVQVTGYSHSYALRITPPGGIQADLEEAYFFPSQLLTLEHAVEQPMSRDSTGFVFALQGSEYATETPERLQGVLVAREEQFSDGNSRSRALAIDVPVQASPAASAQDPAASVPALPLLLVLAMAGGFFLNLMPCVFPILSIKVLGFAQHGRQQPGAMQRHGLLFATGVVVSFLALAGLLLSLRAAGNQIGWGFQLQSPLFVAGMALLFFGIGLSLLGVFNVGTLSFRWAEKALSHSGYQRSFWDGALATLVATPCTAPFMGAALGAAVVLPPLESLLIFAFLGVGMATPYVTLSMMPALLRKLPAPGAWMETLKHVLAFPMIATTIWLVWVFGNQVGVNGMAFLLLGLLFLGVALWSIGRWPAAQTSRGMRLAARLVAAVALLLSLYSTYRGTESARAAGQESEDSSTQWQPFSMEQIASLRTEGRAVFVDFTAAWCLTCQVNKRTTLNSDAVQAAFAQKGVVLMRADWTSRDDEITRALESHGRSGVPLYVLYPGNKGQPTLLPEVLTESIVLEVLASLPDRVAGSV